MYFKLALRNLKNATRQYTIYFLTLIFGVILFYTFNSLDNQSVMLKMSEQQTSAFNQVNQVMGIVSIFLAFVLGFLIIYSNKYMIKYRSREFSIYLTLGMKHSKLSWMLFIENFLIGIMSLIIGMIGGLFTSQLLAIITSHMFSIPFTHFQFVFSINSCVKTIALFLVIYMAVFIFNVLNIRHLSIVDLLKNDQKAELNIKLPNYVYILLFACSIALLGWADISIWNVNMALLSVSKLSMYILAGIVGTILFFFSTTNLLLLVIKKIPRLYFRNLNPFVFRQISSEMTTSFISLSVTCLMIFISICMLAGGFGMNAAMTQGIKLATPYEGSIQSPVNIDKEMAKHNITLPKKDVNQAKVVQYEDSEVKSNQFVQTKYKKQLDNYYLFQQNQPVPLVSLSQVNKSLKLIHKDSIHLKENQYLITGTRPDIKNKIKLNASIHINGMTLHSKDNNYHTMGFYDVPFAMDPIVLIVPDKALQKAKPNYYYLNLSFRNKNVENKILKQFNHSSFAGECLTRNSVIEQASILGILSSYLGIYIGFVFLIASAVLLAIQQLTKSNKDKKRYRLLAEIGATRRQRLSALRIQMMIFFGFPLFLALFHSIFGLHYASEIVSSIGSVTALPNILISLMIIIVVYIGYFILTYLNAKRYVAKN